MLKSMQLRARKMQNPNGWGKWMTKGKNTAIEFDKTILEMF